MTTIPPAIARAEPDTFHITLLDTGESFDCRRDETVLNALARTGRRGIPTGCRGGGCGVCKVAIVSGEFVKRTMSRAHVSEADEKVDRVLACCVFPRAHLSVRVIGKLQRAVGAGGTPFPATS